MLTVSLFLLSKLFHNFVQEQKNYNRKKISFEAQTTFSTSQSLFTYNPIMVVTGRFHDLTSSTASLMFCLWFLFETGLPAQK